MVTTHNKHDNENIVLSQLPHADQPILVTGHNGVDDDVGLTDHTHVHREHYLVFCSL